MTINVQLRKGSRTVLTESLLTAALKKREAGEEINVIVYPGAVLAVLEDGATAEEIAGVLAQGETA